MPRVKKNHVLADLVGLSNRLGDPAMDGAILAEGNTSARIDAGSFWVKASGTALRTARSAQFVRMDMERTLAMLRVGEMIDTEVKRGLMRARVDGARAPMPSVESAVHAVCLQRPGVMVVGHTHPTAINAITCSKAFSKMLAGRLFPDEIVLLGPAPLLIPYVDPGLPLARELSRRLKAHVAAYREEPRAIYLQNHGFIAMGETAQQVEDITSMAIKAARILAGAASLGGPRFLPAAAVKRIHDRPDELHRRRMLDGRKGQ